MWSATTAGLCVMSAFISIWLVGCGTASKPDDPVDPSASTSAMPTTTTVTTTTTVSRPAPTEKDVHCTELTVDGTACSACDEGYAVVGGACLFACSHDTSPDTFKIIKNEQKGLCLDDASVTGCAEDTPYLWPNTNTPIKTLRLVTSWPVVGGTDGQQKAWDNLVRFVKNSGVKVLVGTIITCNHTDDDRDWANTLELIKRFGADHIMGLAIGNEIELLYQKDYVKYWPNCIHDMWDGGYYWRTTQSRIKDMDALGPEFHNIPVTSVVGAASFSGFPFQDDANARVNTYLEKATKTYGNRWAFSVNLYPYFDPGNHLDPGTSDKCESAIERDLCYDKPTCVAIALVKDLRDRMFALTKSKDYKLWVGETGWSHPMADTLAPPEMMKCTKFSSKETFVQNYGGYLNWDLKMPASTNVEGPDHVFYFTLRDSNNFGYAEHFGLLSDCGKSSCKFQKMDYSGGPTPPSTSKCKDLKCGNHDNTCWCTESCVSHNSCCPDYKELCAKASTEIV